MDVKCHWKSLIDVYAVTNFIKRINPKISVTNSQHTHFE